jgi:hypothetical protein
MVKGKNPQMAELFRLVNLLMLLQFTQTEVDEFSKN